MLGLRDRGVLRPGAAADMVIFDLAELQWLPETLVRDVPGGVARLRRPPGGYRYTILAGEIVQAHGRSVDILPGRFLGASDRCAARAPDPVAA
jgi:N-acyl-D-aspartate/D-glutamate deacylase